MSEMMVGECAKRIEIATLLMTLNANRGLVSGHHQS